MLNGPIVLRGLHTGLPPLRRLRGPGVHLQAVPICVIVPLHFVSRRLFIITTMFQ